MPVQLNHTIVHATDQNNSARFLTTLLGLPDAVRFGPFSVVEVANGVSLDFMTVPGPIVGQHYAFLVTEEEFDEIFGRIRAQNLDYWADPYKSQPQQINTHDGGRGVYWNDPDGHALEIITRPYGSGSA
ncbi:VOC family protein [Lentzea sp. NPDC059081]|uniref:VOC family protein n=1 Tax=Lentzea sp. NPDC059081 TaxID=3346719 RepID=UPI0036ABAAE9